jgi:hypothetical protein
MTEGQGYVGLQGCFALSDKQLAQALDAITTLKNNTDEKNNH